MRFRLGRPFASTRALVRFADVGTQIPVELLLLLLLLCFVLLLLLLF